MSTNQNKRMVIRLACKFCPIIEAMEGVLIPSGSDGVYKIPLGTLEKCDQELHVKVLQDIGYSEPEIEEWMWFVTVDGDRLEVAKGDRDSVLNPSEIARAIRRKLYVEVYFQDSYRVLTYSVDEYGIASGARTFERHRKNRALLVRELTYDGKVIWEHPRSSRLAA